MFERYTQSARRMIFFARYEASNYGSSRIEPEHLLLAFLREHHKALEKWIPEQKNIASEICAEIGRQIPRGEFLPTSVEIPLSPESRKALDFAAQASDRLAMRYIEPEHLLVGVLRVEKSLGAQILKARGVNPDGVLQHLAEDQTQEHHRMLGENAHSLLREFLERIKSPNEENLGRYFARTAEVIDAAGNRLTREEIAKTFQALFAPYAKKNAAFAVEETLAETIDLCVATVLWKNTILASEERVWMHRMSVILVTERGLWKILLLQITPVRASSRKAAG